MSYTLVIVDCQNDFACPDDSRSTKMAARRIENLILQTQRDKAYILVVEFAGCGPTWKEIRDLIKDYDRKGFCRKPYQDGGKEVVRYLRRRKWPTDRVLFCGLYADLCVADTAITVSEKLPKSTIEVCRAACISSACQNGSGKRFAWHYYGFRPKNLKMK